MTEQEDSADGELVASVVTDPLRNAFAAAIGALIQALPPSYARDTAVEQNHRCAYAHRGSARTTSSTQL